MKKIAVGDLGEFWYGDYKEPFEQLEGGVPGHPVGVVLKDDDGRLLCAFCGKTYSNLGAHSFNAHGLNAKAYKQEVGLLQKSALVSETVRQRSQANALRLRASDPSWSSRMGGSKQVGITAERRKTIAAEYNNKTGRCYAQVLAVARTLASQNRLTVREMRRVGIHEIVVNRYFGTFTKLRQLCGRPVAKQWTDEELLSGLRSLAASLGRTPTDSDRRRFGLPTNGAYQNHFGSYSKACLAAGLQPNLPVPDGRDLDVSVLVAYATTPNHQTVGRALGIDSRRVSRTLHRYGFPFPAGSRSDHRRDWAAEMARRVAA